MTCGLTWCFRRYALAKQLIDIPNHRSSHTIPTPRGGGVVFVLVFLLSMFILMKTNRLVWGSDSSLLGALLVTAGLGFWDDRKSLPAIWRLMGQILVCLWVLIDFSPFPTIQIYHYNFSFGYAYAVGVLIYLVWMLNLYNFMDGIDGLAASEALIVCLAMSVIYGMTGHAASMASLLVLAATMMGFLFWNFPPARIFMGDAGSGFLGLLLAIFSLQSITLNANFIWVWLILMGCFIVDATLTLMVRMITKQRIFEAHNCHAYQKAVRLVVRHRPVMMTMMMINLVWLFPLALLVGLGYLNGFLTVFIAYLPLIIVAFQLQAGRKNPL